MMLYYLINSCCRILNIRNLWVLDRWYLKLFHRFSFQKVLCSPFKKYFLTIVYFTLWLLFIIIINHHHYHQFPTLDYTKKKEKENCYCWSLQSLLGWGFYFSQFTLFLWSPKINNLIVSRLYWFLNDFK